MSSGWLAAEAETLDGLCGCVVFRTGERHGWPRPHLHVRGLCNPAGADRKPRRPWWFWLALVAYVGIAALELWVVYRTAAGHPVLGGIQW